MPIVPHTTAPDPVAEKMEALNETIRVNASPSGPLLAPLIKRINVLEEKLREPDPKPFPNKIEPQVTGSKRSPYYWVYLRINNKTEADYAIAGQKIVLSLDRAPTSAANGTFSRRDDGNYAIVSSSPIIREDRSLRISLKFDGTKTVIAKVLGWC